VEQVATVMVATVSITAEHGSFNRIRMMAPYIPPSNILVPWASSSNGISIGSVVIGELRRSRQQTDRQTDTSLAAVHIYQHSAGDAG